VGRGLFITATDTGVGKTVISAALLFTFKALGLRIGAMKPIETGCPRDARGSFVPDDGLFLRQVAGMDDDIGIVTPCAYESPLSPYDAAEVEGRPVDRHAIFKAYGLLREKYDLLVVEGAGGIHVPIGSGYFMCDLARDMGLPLIVVARPTLGTLNHTLLTVQFGKASGVEVAGIVLNYSCPPGGTLAEQRSRGTLERLSGVPVMGVFPHVDRLTPREIERTARSCLDLNPLKGMFGRARRPAASGGIRPPRP